MLFQVKDVSGHHQIDSTAAIDIRADYVAKNGAPSAAAPKIFFRYYVNSSTGENSGVMLAETIWTART